MQEINEIGIAYFEWGWIITCAISAYFGWLSGKRRNPKILLATWIGAGVIGGIMILSKYA